MSRATTYKRAGKERNGPFRPPIPATSAAGPTQIRVLSSQKHREVMLAFGEPIQAVTFSPEQAIEIGKLLITHGENAKATGRAKDRAATPA